MKLWDPFTVSLMDLELELLRLLVVVVMVRASGFKGVFGRREKWFGGVCVGFNYGWRRFMNWGCDVNIWETVDKCKLGAVWNRNRYG